MTHTTGTIPKKDVTTSISFRIGVRASFMDPYTEDRRQDLQLRPEDSARPEDLVRPPRTLLDPLR